MRLCQIHCTKWRETKESRFNLNLSFHGFMGGTGVKGKDQGPPKESKRHLEGLHTQLKNQRQKTN